jgi:hypothetical protein
MNSLKKTARVIQSNLLPHVTLKHMKLFNFGLKAFSLSPFASLASNARQTISNRNTAHSKLFRLVSNKRIIHNFHTILYHIHLVKKHSLVNVDFSTFCGFQTLAFGVQTGKGRAIPVWADCITYPITDETSQNIFIIDQMKKFKDVLGFYPSFVFDRGFMIPELIKFMVNNNIVFYVRIKAGKNVRVSKEDTKRAAVEKLKDNDSSIWVYGAQLRVIRSEKPDNENEPWYILTNDFGTSREKVIRIYYCRFEIEEVFKDMKYLFTMKKLWIKKKQTFIILLWFVVSAFWIAWLTDVIAAYLEQQAQVPVKKHISWVKLWFEDMTRDTREIAYRHVGLTGG